MTNAVVRYGSYGGFSGPWIRGTCRFKPDPVAAAMDLVMAAVARPEGGAWDTVMAYDGTAVTAGLFQWTLTSGRLQKLLARLNAASGLRLLFSRTIGKLLSDLGLKLDSAEGWFVRDGKPVTARDRLRDLFTPPVGRVPKQGPKWEQAKTAVLAFHTFLQHPAGRPVQTAFFLEELCLNSKPKRPQMDGRTIAEVLYPRSHPSWRQVLLIEGTTIGFCVPIELPYDACRALFWSCWQNAPRQAEKVLYRTFRQYGDISVSPEKFTLDFCRRVAASTFGNWGIAKAAKNKRTSRYFKMVSAINELAPCALPEKA